MSQPGCKHSTLFTTALIVTPFRCLQAITLWEMSWAGQCCVGGPPAFSSRPLAPTGSPSSGGTPALAGEAADGGESAAAPTKDGPPSLLQCFVATVVLSRRQPILEDCDGADAVFCLFGSPRLEFGELLQSAQALRRHLTLGYQAQQRYEEVGPLLLLP